MVIKINSVEPTCAIYNFISLNLKFHSLHQITVNNSNIYCNVLAQQYNIIIIIKLNYLLLAFCINAN